MSRTSRSGPPEACTYLDVEVSWIPKQCISWSATGRALPAAVAEIEWMVITCYHPHLQLTEPGHLHGAFCSAQASKLQSPEYACSDVADMTKRDGRVLCTGWHFTRSSGFEHSCERPRSDRPTWSHSDVRATDLPNPPCVSLHSKPIPESSSVCLHGCIGCCLHPYRVRNWLELLLVVGLQASLSV